MKKILFLFLITFQFACNAQEMDYKAVSEKIFKNILNRKFGEATQLFDTSFAAKMDSVRLQQAWDRLLTNFGAFVKVVEINHDHQPNFDVVIQKLQLEKKKVDFKIVYGINKKIKGISFLPGEPREKYELPEYFNEKLVVEKSIIIENGPVRLPGILTTPNKSGKFPLVILVHGSGPNDKDESVGLTKIFKDLSIGLANKGIAVYRYDKRSRVLKTKISKEKNYTVNKEIVEDAIAAINQLKQDSLVDSTAIYVCGHGLGGMVIPRIEAKAKNVKGFIFLASNARKLEDHMLEQTRYVISLDTTKKDYNHLLDSIAGETEKIKSLSLSSKDTTAILFLPVSYWLDLNQYNQVDAVQKLNQPMLFLWGQRDYQITETDFNIWKKALANKKAEFRAYPDLNHFFIKGVGKSTPFEYNKKGNVDLEPINDISNWILSQKK